MTYSNNNNASIQNICLNNSMVLYHASGKKNLSILKPQPTLSNNVHIGHYVFATDNLLLAKMYLANKGVPILMNPDKKLPTIVICSDAKEYTDNDIGGAIYELDGSDFVPTPQSELSDFEMVSTNEVKPLSKMIYNTSLEAFKKSEIKVYFVDKTQFNKLINNPKQKQCIDRLSQHIY